MSVFDSIDAIENPIEINGDALIKKGYNESIWGNPHVHESVEQCTIYSKLLEGMWKDKKRGWSTRIMIELIYFPETFEGYVTSMARKGICPKGRVFILATLSDVDEEINKEINYQQIKNIYNLDIIENYIKSKLKKI